jgi:hypothetical protein
MGGKKLFPISNIILNLVPAAFSFFSEFKLAYHPLHYVWEFLTIHWCVWNSLLTAFYNWRELHGKKQSSLGIVVAISNFVNTFVFSITFIVKRDLIGRGRSWYWWSYSLVWHYLAPILAIIYFFCRAKISPPKFLKKRNKKAFLSFLGTVILHPALFTLANFLRKWIIVFRREEIFLKEIPIPNTEIVLKFKKFMVL